ncbi:hypothetical protein ACTFIZ_006559 [Dictyostelium cf. discoideum]
MNLKNTISIFKILIILFSFYNVAFSDDTEKYTFKGTFGTSTLTNSKTNSVKGSADVIIARVDGGYKFSYNISLTGIDGTDVSQLKLLGPSAPNTDGGQLKLTLSFDSSTVLTSSKFVGGGSQTVAPNSPTSFYIGQTLIDITSEKSNYANEQFYITVATFTEGAQQPVSRSQLLYTGSSNTPNSGGGTNPNGSSDVPPTVGPISSSDSTNSDSSSSDTVSSSSSSSSSSLSSNDFEGSDNDSLQTDSTVLNPGGVETSSAGSSTGTTSTTTDSKDSSTGNSILPTLIIVTFFVLTLVIMS